MNVSVGSSVTKKTKSPSEHGVVTEVGAQTVYEDPKELIPDTPCPFCKL